MEEKLFWIGILMGLHLFGSYWLKEKKKLGENTQLVRIWHSVFSGLLGFIIMILISVSLDNRNGDVSTTILFTGRQIGYGIFGLIAASVYSWFVWDDKDTSAKDGVLKIISSDMEWSETIFSAVLLASVVMYLFVQAFKIPSSSMEKTFLVGDHLFVNKIVYGLRIPYTDVKLMKFFKVKRGDIVIFRFPSEDVKEYQCGGYQYGRDFIKRVIALPGEKIEIKNGKIYINDNAISDEKYAQYIDANRTPKPETKLTAEDFQQFWSNRQIGKMFAEGIKDNFGPVTIPEKSYFVMGDNRDRSCDSRYWGPVPEHKIKGKAWVTYWPPSRIGFPY